MDYNWIQINNFPHLTENDEVILFGAGEGSVQLFHFLNTFSSCPRIIAVADNDPSMWGKLFKKIPIIDPSNIPELFFNDRHTKIIVTTVSGREAVGKQLENMGFEEGRHFIKIGCYPSNALLNCKWLLNTDARYSFLTNNCNILHVGPGGFLGLECSLVSLGFRVTSVDAFDFSMNYPDISDDMVKYNNLRDNFLVFANECGYDIKEVNSIWDRLINKKSNKAYLDISKIVYEFPHRFSKLPFEDNSKDLIVSFDVLEHVKQPDMVIKEIKRILKPGGFCIHRILTRDHRSFNVVNGYTPISYLYYSEEEWEHINSNKFYQNRVLPFEWKNKFVENGFDLLEHNILENYEISNNEYEKLDRSYKILDPKFLTEINCVQVLKTN